jgi:hypothetical protein
MSGSSSAYLNGHLSDRQRTLVKRKDLDLSELIKICSEPLGIDERVALVQQYSSIYPELKFFLIVAYFCKNAFSQINQAGPIEFTFSKVPKGGSTETLQSMWKEVTRLYDTFPSGPKIKRGPAYQLLTSLHKDDAVILSELLHGKFYRKELNEVVVSKAFPNETPQLPKP